MTEFTCRVPSAYPAGPEGGLEVKVISGKSHGVESPVRPLGGCWFFHVIFKNKGTIFQDIREFCFVFLMWVIKSTHHSIRSRWVDNIPV